MRTVNFLDAEIATVEDFSNLGTFSREAMDATVADLGGFTAPRYTGLQVEQTGQSTVRVGQGRFYKPDGSVFIFQHDGGQSIDMLAHLPAVAKRIATVVAYGNTIQTAIAEREFLRDIDNPDDDSTVSRQVATESRRQAYVGEVYGQENPTPTAPAIQSDYVAVAHVVLTPAGIESITQLTANRVVSSHRLSQDVSAINTRLGVVGPQIDTLRTDISGMAAYLRSRASRAMVASLVYDMAQVKEKIDLPDDYAAYAADHFLDDAESDTEHADYSCLIREGLRFPTIAGGSQAITLENPIEPRVIVNNGMALPRFTPVTRISVVGRDGEYPLTNATVSTVEYKELTATRTVREFLTNETLLLWAGDYWWQKPEYDAASNIFRRGDEEFWIPEGLAQEQYLHSGSNSSSVNVLKTIVRDVDYKYWDYVTTNSTVTGSVVTQSFLNSQDGYLLNHRFLVTKKASAGDIWVICLEVDDSDRPIPGRVLGNVVVPVSAINVWPQATQASFPPIFVPKGKRYAFQYVSSGAHFLATVAGNKFAQGAMYALVDGEHRLIDANTDIAMEVDFARFDSPVVAISLAPLELAGGIDTIRINADVLIPDGTVIDFRVKVAGEWKSLSEMNASAGYPGLVQFQAVFVGTTDAMPALGVGAGRSEIQLRRAGTALTHISKPRLLPTNVETVEVSLELDNFLSGHSCAISLLRGAGYATPLAASATVDTPHPTIAGVITRKASFTLPAPADRFKIKIVGASGANPQRFRVTTRTDIEFVD